jgi:SAM-dependent methyltransferase
MPPRARYDPIAEMYVETVGDDVSDPATASLLDLLGDVATRRVLDMACGHGRIARELARRGADVVGVDISAVLLAKAKALEAQSPLGVSYLWADVSSPQCLEGEIFDIVVCNFGLSDIDDLPGTLATVARILRPHGIFAFSILHPCFPGSGENAPSSWPPSKGYFDEGWWLAQNPGFRGKVGSNFRMLSTYLNALIGHGLQLDEAAEPRPSAGEASDALRAQVPWYLVLRTRKVRAGSGMDRAPLKGMATEKQRQAARRNIKKAQAAAREKRTIANLPKSTRTALGKQGAKVAKQKRSS